MRIRQQFCILIVLIGLTIAASVSSEATPVSLLVYDSAWSLGGAATTGGAYASFLMLPTVNPQTLNTPTSVIFGSTITTGSGSDTFNTSVSLTFLVTQNGITHNFVAVGTIVGSISDKGSRAHVTFLSLTDTTSGKATTVHTFIDPGSRQRALFLNTVVGGIYVDYAEPIGATVQNPGTISGFISPLG